jgi:8-oxo-dGTP diphosphatase
MMGTMKPVKRSVAVVVRRPGRPAAGDASAAGEFLIVRRPDDPGDPLAGAWGLPAVSLRDGEDERAAVVRAGRVKLGVELAVGARIGEKSADRDGYRLRLADYEATVLAGVPAVPQPDHSVTQYTECRYTTDPGTLTGAAARGSLCAQVFLEDNSKKRLAAERHA